MQENARGVHSVPSTVLMISSLSLEPSITFERRTSFTPGRNTNKQGLSVELHSPIDSLHSRCGCRFHLLQTQTHLLCPFSSVSLAFASRRGATHPGGLVLLPPGARVAPRFIKVARTDGCMEWRLTLRSCCASLSLLPQMKPLLIGYLFPHLHLSHAAIRGLHVTLRSFAGIRPDADRCALTH